MYRDGTHYYEQQSICFTANSSYAQSWAKTYGGTAGITNHAIQQTSDEGYILVGDNKGILPGVREKKALITFYKCFFHRFSFLAIILLPHVLL
jgi:hypothetical protein